MVFAERLASLMREHEPDAAFIDMDAMEAPVYDRLCHLGFGHMIMDINFSQGAIRDDLYLNRRSDMWHAVAKSSKIGRALVGKECRSRWSPYH